MHVERTFTVPRPVDEVFAFLADFTTTEQWDPGTISTVRTGGDGGLGTTYANVSAFMGRRVELVYETVLHDAPRRVRFRGRNGRTTATDSLSLTALAPRTGVAGGGTSIHYRADFDFPWPLRLVTPVVVGLRLPALADETVEQMRRCLA